MTGSDRIAEGRALLRAHTSDPWNRGTEVAFLVWARDHLHRVFDQHSSQRGDLDEARRYAATLRGRLEQQSKKLRTRQVALDDARARLTRLTAEAQRDGLSAG